MALKRQDKAAIVASVHQQAAVALSAVIADYRGLSVSELTDLRKTAREQSVYLKIIRNTLMRQAVKNTQFECLDNVLVGPTILALSLEDPGAAARIAKEFAKTHDKFKVRALAVGGRQYAASDIDVLASLPTRDQAIATLMMLMLAPVTKLARTLNEIPARLVRTVAAVADQKKAN